MANENENIKRDGQNYMKRDVSVMVSQGLTGTKISAAGTGGVTIAKLPDKSMIVDIIVLTTTVSTDVNDTLDVNRAGSGAAGEKRPEGKS